MLFLVEIFSLCAELLFSITASSYISTFYWEILVCDIGKDPVTKYYECHGSMDNSDKWLVGIFSDTKSPTKNDIIFNIIPKEVQKDIYFILWRFCRQISYTFDTCHENPKFIETDRSHLRWGHG